MDGDALFTLAYGEDAAGVVTVGLLAEDAIRVAVIDALTHTETPGGHT